MNYICVTVNSRVMCVAPITIKRNLVNGSARLYTVPCGKCPECLSKKRSQVAAMAVSEGLVSGDVAFFTLTYNDEYCPVAHSFYDVDNDCYRLYGLTRGCYEFNLTPSEDDKHYMNAVFSDDDGFFRACSLWREDVKNWFKVFRKKYHDRHGKNAVFKYVFFGELGELRGRPHYHGLVFGLDRESLEMLRDCWRFGSVLLLPETNRKPSYEEIAKMSNYVSKYVSKGVHSRFAELLPFIEKPRRQSSINLGSWSDQDIEKYRSMRRATLNRLDASKLPLNEDKSSLYLVESILSPKH